MTERFELDRRALLSGAVALVGGSLIGLPGTAFAEIVAASEQARYFTPGRFALLDEVCAVMIPLTDTPGAREAGVPAFIDGMMTRWASAGTKREFDTLLDDVDAETGGFAALPASARIEALRAYDASRLDGDNEAYRRFRDLLLTGYYLSEAGATQELRYELSPGLWEAAIDAGPDTRAWAV